MRDGLVVSPADGVVSFSGYATPPPELGLGARPMQRVSIFMSVFDCHVNRAPVAGRVARRLQPGLFLNADLDKASEDNERNGLVIESAAGTFGVVQIAGLIARRIVCFVDAGADLAPATASASSASARGSTSTCPTGARAIGLGARAIAGETVIAEFGRDGPPRQYRLS